MMQPSEPALHIDVYGSGRPLVLLHGWGMHGGVFKSLAGKLAHSYSVYAVDLPGHGHSAAISDFYNLPRLGGYCMNLLMPILEQAAVLVGWSLGGLLAQQLAVQFPDRISKLILLNSTPCFRQRSDWPYAIEDEVLAGFTTDLGSNIRSTLSRFLALQFMGTPDEKQSLRKAREIVFDRPMAGRDTLEQGLRLLREQDLRDRLSQIKCPLLSISGERDRLVPTNASVYLAEHIDAGRAVIVRGAGHAPFLTHESIVSRIMEEFINER